MNLRTLRQDRGVSLRELSAATNLPKTSLSEWENGNATPSAESAMLLAKFYGITVEELLSGEKPKALAPSEEEEIILTERDEHGFQRRVASLKEVEQSISQDLEDVKKRFFKIGRKLNYINNYFLYTEEGFENITDYAEAKFGFGKSTTYNMINVYEMIREYNDDVNIQKKYLPYNFSQLVEIAGIGYYYSKDSVLDVVKPSDSAREIGKYIKLYKKACNEGSSLKGSTVKEALEFAAKEEEKKNALPAPTLVESESNACPGQTSIFDEEEYGDEYVPENECIIDENSCDEVDYSFTDEDYVKAGLITEDEDISENVRPERHVFKNAAEREDFIKDKNNYNVLVLENKELNLKITRLDFANGAKVYRSEYLEYLSWNKEYVKRTSYCLIDKREDIDKPPTTACCTDYSLKCFNFDGTAPGYIVKYMTMYKDEI